MFVNKLLKLNYRGNFITFISRTLINSWFKLLTILILISLLPTSLIASQFQLENNLKPQELSLRTLEETLNELRVIQKSLTAKMN